MAGTGKIIIEIRSSEVRGALYSSFLGKTGIERLESTAIEDGKVSSAIGVLLSKFPSDAAVMLQLPGHLFMVRNLSLPFSDRKKIRKALPFEMDGVLPIPSDELLLDSVFSCHAEKGSGIIAAAIPKKTVHEYAALFPEGRRPARVIPDFISLLSLGRQIKYGSGACGILNIEDGEISLAVISDGRPAIVRSAAGINDASLNDWLAVTIKPLQKSGTNVEMLYVTGRKLPASSSLREITQPLPCPASLKGVSAEEWPSCAVLAGGSLSASEFPWFNILGSGADGGRLEKVFKILSAGMAVLLVLGTGDMYLRYKTASQHLLALKAETRKIFQDLMPGVKKIVKEDAQLKDALIREKALKEAFSGKSAPYLPVLGEIERLAAGRKGIRIREAVFEGRQLVINGDVSGIEGDELKRLFSGMEGVKEAMVEEIVQGVTANSSRFRIKIDLKAISGHDDNAG